MSARRLLPLALLLLAACGGPPPGPPSYPGQLRPTSEIGRDFVTRQQISGRHGEQSFRFEAVLQKQGDVLLLLGLTPFGTRAFVIEQRGTEVSHRTFLEEELPFPPRFVLLDVHRTLFLGISEVPMPDGVHAQTRGDERIGERWVDGRLRSRTFERVSGDPPGIIRIEYEGGALPGEMPALVRLHNGWLGYSLEVRALPQ